MYELQSPIEMRIIKQRGKKKMKKALLLAAALLSVSIFAGCQNTTNQKTEQTSSEQAAKQSAQIIIKADGKETANQTVDFKEGDSLYEVMEQNFAIKADNGFITEIDGHKQDQKASKYWTFTLNGEMATKGAKDIQLKNGDKVNFELAAMK
jgi:outer membrane murein-binding lipoprotein Lpp